MSRLIKLAKIGLLLLTGFLAAVAIGQLFQEPISENFSKISLQQLAVSSHVTFATDAVYPVHVASDDIDHLARWISYRLDKQVPIKRLDQIGYTLLGGNLVPDGDSVAASIVYENKQQVRMTLLVRLSPHAPSKKRPIKGQRGEFNWLSWENGQGQQVIVSDLNQTELQKIFSALQG